ncbi:hypothetical protein C4A76_12435 [Brevibacillus laterosporus]|nr:hypothetical protein C4A76_12435 [Brevibacillus laterosporus]
MKLSQRFIVTSFTLWFNAFFHISSYSLIEGYRLTSFQRNFLEKNKRYKKRSSYQNKEEQQMATPYI